MKAARETQPPYDAALYAKEMTAARAAARQFEQELARIDGRIDAAAVEAGRTADDARAAELLAERDALIRRKEVLPGLLRGARARYLRACADDYKAQAAVEGAHLAAAQAEMDAATAEFDAAAAALERAATRLKTAERGRDEHAKAYGYLMSEAGAREIDEGRIAQGLAPFQPGWFDEPT
jgi:hypothetical protein